MNIHPAALLPACLLCLLLFGRLGSVPGISTATGLMTLAVHIHTLLVHRPLGLALSAFCSFASMISSVY
ncbi:hypothetical protein LZ32DRAFT_609700 [Colletotrichum eremochloae]|nr:hypothetical protein LZ32DRAFT_609700 [Colletotrichum eremochloae]